MSEAAQNQFQLFLNILSNASTVSKEKMWHLAVIVIIIIFKLMDEIQSNLETFFAKIVW